jgi:hypothetical protein
MDSIGLLFLRPFCCCYPEHLPRDREALIGRWRAIHNSNGVLAANKWRMPHLDVARGPRIKTELLTLSIHNVADMIVIDHDRANRTER